MVDPEYSGTGEYCKDLAMKSDGQCLPLGTLSCPTDEVVCLTNKDSGPTCSFDLPQIREGKVAEGNRCVPDSEKDNERCQDNADLFCHPVFQICMKMGKAGGPCVNGECEAGSLCHFGKCVPFGTVPDNHHASDGALCESGQLGTDNRCLPTFAQDDFGQQCTANSDCKPFELCDIGSGTCRGALQHAERELLLCKGQRCLGGQNSLNCYDFHDLCGPAYLKVFCAKECMLPVHKRRPLTRGMYSFIVDCQALDLERIPFNRCNILPSQVVKNCDAVFTSFRASSATGLYCAHHGGITAIFIFISMMALFVMSLV